MNVGLRGRDANTASRSPRHELCLLCGGSFGSGGLTSSGGSGGGNGRDVDGAALGKVTKLAAGPGATCVIHVSGAVRCTGATLLGDPSATLVSVPSLEGSAELSFGPGGGFACALDKVGSVSCWGQNAWGQLGTGASTPTESAQPLPVLGVSSVESLAPGPLHACVVFASGSVKCWGDNFNGGAVGAPTADPIVTPFRVPGVSGARGLGLDQTTSCVLLADGTVATVQGLSSVRQVAVGDSHTCALLSDGTAKCWGSNGSGQLGVAGISRSTTPVATSG